MPRFVGIDPGQTGAAVCVAADGCTVVWRMSWRRARRPPELGLLLEAGDVVTLETPYVGLNARSALALATWRGGVIGQLPAGVQLLEPLAVEWRAKVLAGGSWRTRDAAKRCATAAAAAWLERAPVEAGGGRPPSADECEAWCMARYSWGWHLAQQTKIKPRARARQAVR